MVSAVTDALLQSRSWPGSDSVDGASFAENRERRGPPRSLLARPCGFSAFTLIPQLARARLGRRRIWSGGPLQMRSAAPALRETVRYWGFTHLLPDASPVS